MIWSFFQWADATWWGVLIRQSIWGFAIVETIHLFGLMLLLGGIFVISMRLLGLMMVNRPVFEIAEDINTWMLVGLALMLVSGVSLWASEAIRMFHSPWFWLKMAFLLVSLIFQFTLYRKATRRGAPPDLEKLTGVIALILWFGVGLWGRAIGFL
jgi:hypothetical protein